MNTLLLVTSLVDGLVPFADPAPAKEDVKAGWGAFGVFMALALATAFLGWSLIKHLRKAQTNADAGAFGPTDTDTTPGTEPAPGATGDDPTP